MNDRNRSIGEMFSAIAPRYDFLNRFLSLGTDRRWRREAVTWTVPETGGVHLDVATGTADVALEILRQKGRSAFVAGVDISQKMMRLGREKAGRAGVPERLAFVLAPGESLPFRDDAFDSACIAFGIRNVARRDLGIREMHRVLKPGGRIVVLEFSRPEGAFFGSIYRIYFTRVLPRLGGLFSRRSAYSYLPDSVMSFPSPGEFADMLREAGFDPVVRRPLSRGIVTLYVGVKRKP